MKQLEINYVTNKAGDKTAVILPIGEFEELMEDIEDFAAVAERREEPTISHEQLLSRAEARWTPTRLNGNRSAIKEHRKDVYDR